MADLGLRLMDLLKAMDRPFGTKDIEPTCKLLNVTEKELEDVLRTLVLTGAIGYVKKE